MKKKITLKFGRCRRCLVSTFSFCNYYSIYSLSLCHQFHMKFGIFWFFKHSYFIWFSYFSLKNFPHQNFPELFFQLLFFFLLLFVFSLSSAICHTVLNVTFFFLNIFASVNCVRVFVCSSLRRFSHNFRLFWFMYIFLLSLSLFVLVNAHSLFICVRSDTLQSTPIFHSQSTLVYFHTKSAFSTNTNNTHWHFDAQQLKYDVFT